MTQSVLITAAGQTIPVGTDSCILLSSTTGNTTFVLSPGTVDESQLTIINGGYCNLTYEYRAPLTFAIPQQTAATFIWSLGNGVWYPITGTPGVNLNG